MTLRIVDVEAATQPVWREVHNRIIPSSPLSEAEVAERAARNRLTLGYDGDALVGNATVRPPGPEQAATVVIVRVLPELRRRGYGAQYLSAVLDDAKALGGSRIETVVWAGNPDGLRFAVAHGFVEYDRYTLDGDTAAFVDLYLDEAAASARRP